mmetsp:Transcript_59451/g.135804  ORF Transcript_59451/g.135804 Transcript_59451/m.135804 type:complete len:206 (-) Transcript_59451:86-703(-)
MRRVWGVSKGAGGARGVEPPLHVRLRDRGYHQNRRVWPCRVRQEHHAPLRLRHRPHRHRRDPIRGAASVLPLELGLHQLPRGGALFGWRGGAVGAADLSADSRGEAAHCISGVSEAGSDRRVDPRVSCQPHRAHGPGVGDLHDPGHERLRGRGHHCVGRRCGGVGILRVRILPLGRPPSASPGKAWIRCGRRSVPAPAHPMAGCD